MRGKPVGGLGQAVRWVMHMKNIAVIGLVTLVLYSNGCVTDDTFGGDNGSNPIETFSDNAGRRATLYRNHNATNAAIAAVDLTACFAACPATQWADRKLETEAGSYNDERGRLVREYEALTNDLLALQTSFGSSQELDRSRTTREKDDALLIQIRGKEAEIREYDRQKKQRLKDESEQMRRRIVEELARIVISYADAHQFRIVYDSSTLRGNDGHLYQGIRSVNITPEIKTLCASVQDALPRTIGNTSREVNTQQVATASEQRASLIAAMLPRVKAFADNWPHLKTGMTAREVDQVIKGFAPDSVPLPDAPGMRTRFVFAVSDPQTIDQLVAEGLCQRTDGPETHIDAVLLFDSNMRLLDWAPRPAN